MKKQKLRQIKKCKNLSKYDIGKMPSNIGYQPGTKIDTGGFTSQRGEDIQPYINEVNDNILPNAASQVFTHGSNIYNILNSYTPAVAGSTAGMTSSLFATAPSVINAGSMAGGLGKNMFSDITLKPLEVSAPTSYGTIGTSTTSASGGALSAAGKALGAIGALYGTYNLYNGLKGYNDYRRAGDMMNAMSKNTQSVEGVDVTTYGGLDSSAEQKYVDAQNKSSFINNTLSGAGAGASFGSLFGPIGTIVGGAAGALTGIAGSIFGGDSRKDKVNTAIENAQTAASNYNKQAISEAASKGLRNQFYLMHANCGKDRGMKKYNIGKSLDYTKVWTPSGEQYGPVNSLVGKGESLIDYDNGKASYVDKGTRRVDNQPSVAAPGDNIVIAGNDIDITNGISFADQAAPYSKALQKLEEKENLINKNTGSEKTKYINLKQLNAAKNKLFSKLKPITDRQQIQHELLNKNENTPQYNDGKIDFLSVVPYALGMMAPISQYNYYKNMVPTADNSYVANPTERQALQTLGQLRYDPYNQVNAIRNAYRHGLYNINQSGALTSGQRLAMLSQQNNAYMNNIANVYANANDMNSKYKQAYAQALLESGDRSATRQQQALATQQQNYREAIARKRLGIETAQKGMLNIGNTLARNLFDQKQFNASQAYNNHIINMYNQKLDAETKYLLKNIKL